MKMYQIVMRYLRGQKKHTVMAILAVTIATAFTMVMLSGVSVFRASQRNICQAENGTYHVVFNGLDKEKLAVIRSMDIFSESQFYSVSSYSSNTDVDFGQMTDENAVIEYMLVNGMPVDDFFLRLKSGANDLLPENMRTVTEGRMPEKDGEIVISQQSAELWGYPEIGETVDIELYSCGLKTAEGGLTENVPVILAETFDVKEISTKTLTVVGYSDGYNIVDYSDTALKSYSYLTDNLVARFSEKTNDLYWDMHHAFAAAGYEIDDFDYGINQQLLDYEGKGVTAKFSQALFFGVVYLAVIFLMFWVRMVIDNAFEISDRERIRQFGLLKTAGASKKQIFSFVILEALYLAVPGVILGMILGMIFSSLAYNAVISLPYLSEAASDYDLRQMIEYDIRPYVYISSAVIGIFWVIISAVSTGMRSIKATPVEAIRAAGKKETIKPPKHSTGLDKGASFISAYSGLSIKRNKKRYIITMVSLVISIVLFSAFSYGIEIAYADLENEYNVNRQPYDYSVQYLTANLPEVDERCEEMRASGFFENVQYSTEMTMMGAPADVGLDANSMATAETGVVYFSISPINKETYEKNILSDISFEELSSSGKALICADVFENNGTFLYSAYDNIPQAITVSPYSVKTMEIFEPAVIECAGGYKTENKLYRSLPTAVKLIVSEDSYAKLMEKYPIDANTIQMQYSEDNIVNWYTRNIFADAVSGMEEQADNYLEKHFYDRYTNNREDMNFSYAILGIVRILGYFAVGIVAVIAAVNIVNIISSNVLNRTSEFAMLRACGMTDRQIHKLIFTECMIYAVLASFSSLLIIEAAVLVIQLPFMTHFEDLTMEDLGLVFSYTAPLKYIAIASAAAFITAAAASWFPARRIIKSSIVENIRSTEQF